jgi:trehalose 6-phosphate phosphatase
MALNKKIDDIESVIFDLDGVVTDTALVHQECWKQSFEKFMHSKNQLSYEFKQQDYKTFLDGKTRVEGAESYLNFLNSTFFESQISKREINECIDLICFQKNNLFRETAKGRLRVFDDAINFIQKISRAKIDMCVYTSSKNGLFILSELKLSGYFKEILSGTELQAMNLRSKPHHDGYSYLLKNNSFSKSKTLIFEDAESGVKAANCSGAIAVGVYRSGTEVEKNKLISSGAQYTINSFDEIDN